MFAVDSFEIIDIGYDDPQQVIILTGHQVTLHDLRHVLDGFLEGAEISQVRMLEHDMHEYVAGQTELLLIEHRRITLDQAAFFENADSPQAGRLGQIDTLRQFYVADAAVLLQHPKYGAIELINHN